MPRGKKDETPEGTIRLIKLSTDDINRCYVTGVQCEELGGLKLTKSWEELTLALLCLVYLTNPKKFISKLYNAKVISSDFQISPQEYSIYTDNGFIYAKKIPDAPYYLYTDFSSDMLGFKIKQLFNILNVNIKKVLLKITPYSLVASDEIFFKVNKEVQVRKIILSETAYIGFNHNKMLAVDIFGVKSECHTNLHLIVCILHYTSKLYKDWYNRAVKYNKDITLILAKSKEEAKVYDSEPEEIPDTGCYVGHRMNGDSIMEYLRRICQEFSLNTDKIILYCKDSDINKIKTNVYY